jgi:butyryl-CoA dehydrogenase
MDLQLSEEQQLIRETVREFARTHIAPRAAEIDRTREFPLDNYRRCAELNLTGMMVDEEHGGAGLDAVSYAIAVEELSRACATTGVIISVNNSLYCDPVARYGTPAQKQRWLTPFARGEKLGCYCLTEPHSGSDAAALRTMAVRDGDDWVLNGSKVWITNGAIAEVALVWARDEAGVVRGFLVPRDTPGLSAREVPPKMSLRASVTSELVLEDVRLPGSSSPHPASMPRFGKW